MSRKTKRKIGLVAVLAVLLSLLAILYVNFRATKKVGFDVAVDTGESVTAPQFLYSFAGSGQFQLQRPLGVLAEGGNVWVTDSIQGRLLKFREDGTFVGGYGKGTLLTPLYIAKNPVNGHIYVSDRRTRQVHIFDEAGKYLGVFAPKLPKAERPTYTNIEWAPVAMAFAPDGTFYVTELLKGHRLLIFGPDGKFKKSVGDAGIPKEPTQGGAAFQFPNSVKVHGNEVWIADSNNRRLQVFDRDGTFKRMVVTAGLPRGFDFLPQLKGRKKDAPALWAVIDTLAHDATIWDVKGTKLVSFGNQGVLDGQFSYPNDLSVGGSAKIFVADTYNARVQVWGWPSEVSPVTLPPLPQYWGWCLTPLLLLPLLLFLRKKRFAATEDFVDAMLVAEVADRMPAKRRRWIVTEPVYEVLKDRGEGEYAMGDLLEATEYSQSDARALMERFEIDAETAATLALAQRAKVFCTEDQELRRLARMLEIETVDRAEFLERYAKLAKAGSEEA